MKREDIDELTAAIRKRRDEHSSHPADHYMNGLRDGLAEACDVITAMVDHGGPSRPAPLAIGQRRRWTDGRRPTFFAVTHLHDNLVTLLHVGETLRTTLVRSFVESNSELVEGGGR